MPIVEIYNDVVIDVLKAFNHMAVTIKSARFDEDARA